MEVRTKDIKQSDTEVAEDTLLYGERVVVKVVDGQMLWPLIHSFSRQHTVSQVLISSSKFCCYTITKASP